MRGTSMSTRKLLVSVITPSFMQGRFIGECLESVRQQTYPLIEHLVFDACSSDQTLSIISGYVNTYNLIFVREKDRGQAHAINKGFDAARGDIVCWLNSDDLFYDEYVIETVVDTFQQNPCTDIVTGEACYVDDAGKFLRTVPVFGLNGPNPVKFPTRCIVTQPATFWRRNDLRLNEDLDYVFDWQFWIDLSRSGRCFFPLRRCVAKYRIHGQGKTNTDTARRKKEVILLNKYTRAGKSAVAWSTMIYLAYMGSEKTRLPVLKRWAAKVNNAMGLATGYRLFSE